MVNHGLSFSQGNVCRVGTLILVSLLFSYPCTEGGGAFYDLDFVANFLKLKRNKPHNECVIGWLRNSYLIFFSPVFQYNLIDFSQVCIFCYRTRCHPYIIMYVPSNLFLETTLTTRFSTSVLLYDVLNYIFIELLNLDECSLGSFTLV